jgi:hypothetical protein
VHADAPEIDIRQQRRAGWRRRVVQHSDVVSSRLELRDQRFEVGLDSAGSCNLVVRQQNAHQPM